MKKLILILLLISSPIFAVPFSQSSGLPIEFHNQTKFDVTLSPETEGCISYENKKEIIKANSTKTIYGDMSQCTFLANFTTNFSVIPNLKNTHWVLHANNAYINFVCSMDEGLCSSSMNNFPIILKNIKNKKTLTINAKDTTDPDHAFPYKFEITQER